MKKDLRVYSVGTESTYDFCAFQVDLTLCISIIIKKRCYDHSKTMA